MTILQYIKTDSKKIPKTLRYKKNKSLLTIEDQEEALTNPEWAYWLARDVPGADIKKCEEIVLSSMDPGWAYLFARDVIGADIKKCEEIACKDPQWAFWFTLDVPRQLQRRELEKRQKDKAKI